MADYWCLQCGARTGMMGHGDRHDKKMESAIDRVVALSGWDRKRVVEAVGKWQIGEEK